MTNYKYQNDRKSRSRARKALDIHHHKLVLVYQDTSYVYCSLASKLSLSARI